MSIFKEILVKYLAILSILFNVSFMQAEKKQSINLREFVDQIVQTEEDNIFPFAKSTLEDETPAPCSFAHLHLGSAGYFPESDNTSSMIGTYISTQTNEELSKQIQKDSITTGELLLEDFSNSITYKELRKNLETIVCEMTSCSFITPEESKILRESKGFYPDDYEKIAYIWNILSEQDKIKTLTGHLRNVIGLKGNKNNIDQDSFIAIVDILYRCSLDYVIPNKTNFHYEPQHSMNITLTFTRNKDGNCSSVSFIFEAFGGSRRFDSQCNIDTPHEYTFSNPLIYEYWDIAHWSKFDFFASASFSRLIPHISDFIIEKA